MTALRQPSLADTVRPQYHHVTPSPASTAPSVRTTRVTTPVNAGQVHETQSHSERIICAKAFGFFKGYFAKSRDTGIFIINSYRLLQYHTVLAVCVNMPVHISYLMGAVDF